MATIVDKVKYIPLSSAEFATLAAGLDGAKIADVLLESNVNVIKGPRPFPPINPLPAVLSYAAMSWSVFAAPPDGSKKSLYAEEYDPDHQKWGATTKPDKLRRYWKKYPDANVALPTGPENGLLVLDSDTVQGHDVDGIAELKAWERENGELPVTLMAQSPSGSVHHLFRYPEGVTISNSTGKIAPGNDIRGAGGMILAAPSIKPGVGHYKWLNWGTPIADAPQALIDAATAGDADGEHKASEELEARDPEECAAAVAVIKNDDLGWNDRKNIFMAIWSAFGSDDGRDIAHTWAKKNQKFQEANFNKMWAHIGKHPPDRIGAGSLYQMADEAEPDWRELFSTRRMVAAFSFKQGAGAKVTYAPRKKKSGYTVEDFTSFLPQKNYTMLLTGNGWPASSVNSQVPSIVKLDSKGKPVFKKDENGNPTNKKERVSATTWLDQHRPIADVVWAPGEPPFIEDKLLSKGGWIPAPGKVAHNSYYPPIVRLGDAGKAGRWIDLVKRVYPEHRIHLINYFAFKVQHPDQKINHAVMLGGPPGIGKDTMLEPVRHGVGPWNFIEIAPSDLFRSFNSHVKCVMLRISEAHDLGDQTRYMFYNRMKTMAATPPETIRCEEKYMHPYYVLNVGGIILTTNHLLDGIHLPEDDRRHYIAWSNLTKEDFENGYWSDLWQWYEDGGIGHVVAYLHQRDLSDFDAKAPPERTKAFWDIVGANRAPEEAELSDVFDKLKADAVTLGDIVDAADYDLRQWLEDRKNRRTIPHRLASCGYVMVRNDVAKDGHWVVDGKRGVVYAKATLPVSAQIGAANALTRRKPRNIKRLSTVRAP